MVVQRARALCSISKIKQHKDLFVLRKTQSLTYNTNLVLVKKLNRLYELEVQLRRKSAYIVMSLDSLLTLEDVGIDSTLTEVTDTLKLRSLLSEHLDELFADDVSLLLGISYVLEKSEETVNCIYIDEVSLKLVSKYLAYHLGLALTEKSVVNMNAHEVLADSLDKESCDYR